jgi:hypothetical protein
VASTSSATTRPGESKPKKRKVEAEEVLSDDGEEEFKLPALPVWKKGKAAPVKSKSKKVAEVLDLSELLSFRLFRLLPSLSPR